MPNQRRATDELLRQRQLFEKAPGFIAVLRGPNHVFEFVNDAYIRVTGNRDYIGKSIRDAVPELQGQGFIDILDTVYRLGTRHLGQHTRVLLQPRSDRPLEEHYLDFISEPMLDSNGRATAIFIEGFDVTHQHHSEAALRDMNSKLADLVAKQIKERDRVWANSRDLLIVIGADGVFRAVSPAWTRMLGHACDEVVGHRFLEFIHPDDAALTENGLDPAIAARDLSKLENRLIRKDSAVCWISWRTSVEGDLVYGYGRDITAEKLSMDTLAIAQSRLRAIFETTYLFQGLLSPTGQLLDANKTALSAIDKELNQILGMAFWETPWFSATPGMPETVRAAVMAAASGSIVRQEIHVNLPTGGWRWFDFSLRPVRDASGLVVAIVPEALELTDRKHTEEALHQSQKLDAMGQLTGGVAHDFNNLLVPIVGSLDLLHRRGVGGEREQRLIVNAMKSAERAKLLVQRLLAFARRQPLQPVPVHVGMLMEEISALVDSTTGPQIRVVVDIEDKLPAANADPNQLEMAILNLSVNARDAMPDGGTLTISATCRTIEGPHRTSLEPGKYICLSVADSGCGMDPGTLRRAIEPFFSTKGVGKGTGLGLSMVHGLASQLGGALSITSDQGVGTNVELWLPVSAESAEVPEAKTAGFSMPDSSRIALLVDDEDMIRLATADMLNELGFKVIEASSAKEALAVLRRGDPIDILITDHLMPGMTGVDLAHTVIAERPEVPVLIVSGFAEVEGLPSHLPRLSKPFRQADLATVLQNLVGGKENLLH
jgi:PAS domain S-box-containing protein